MSYDNGFQSKESGSSHYPEEEHYYLGEKIKPQPTFYRRYIWQILVSVLIMLVLVIASFTAGLLIRQKQQTPTSAPPTSVKLLLSAPRIASTDKSVITIPSGTTVRLTVVPDHSLLPFQIDTMGIYATDPYGFSELQDCTYPNTATCSYVVAYSSSENTDYTKGQHTFRAFLGNIGGRILTNSNNITIIWS